MVKIVLLTFILLKEGRIWADGTPAEVLTEDIIKDVISASVRVEPHPLTGAPHIVVIPKESAVKRKEAP